MKPEDIQATKWTLTCTVLNTQTTALTGNVRIDTSAIVKRTHAVRALAFITLSWLLTPPFVIAVVKSPHLVKNNSCGQKTSMSFIKVRSRWWKAIRKGSPRHSIAWRQASWASRPTALLTFKNRGSRENMPSEHFSVVYLFINRFRSLFVDWTLYIQILITQTCAELHFPTKMHQLTSQKTDPDAHLHCLCFFSWTYTKRILAC